jgi:hypothetical protein
MRRLEVWIDSDVDNEKELKEKVKAALDKLGVSYTIMSDSTEIIEKGSQK